MNSQVENKSIRKFGLLDVMKTVMDLVIFNAGMLLLGISAIPAHLISVTLALGFSLWVNKRFMFGPSLKRRFTQVLLLLLITAFGLYILQTATIYLLLYVWQWPLEIINTGIVRLGLDGLLASDLFFANSAKLIAIFFSAISNYILFKNLKVKDQRLPVVDRLGDWLADHKDTVILAGILLVAIVARFWRLHVLPSGLDPAEAVSGLNALSILNGNLSLFYRGQEGLFSYLQALSVAVTGNTMLALRLIPAFIGVAAVLATYAAAREWFSMRVALLAAFFMAIAPWAVQVSRSGFNAVLLTLFVPLLMLVIAKAVKTNSAVWWVVTGVVFGLGFYTHISYYFVVLVALLAVVFARFRYRQHLGRLKQPLAIIVLSASLAIIPLALQFIISPEVFLDRGAELNIIQTAQQQDNIIDTTVTASIKTAGMFHFAGDNNYLHNLGGEPQLNMFVGILFILGILLAIKRRRDVRYITLLALLTAFTAPSILAGSMAPDALLASGAIPLIYILAAVGLVELYVRWKGIFPHNVLAYNFALSIIIVVTFVSGTYNYQRYFVAWANAPETFEAHDEQLYASARHLITNPIDGEYSVLVDSQNDIPIHYLTDDRASYARVDPRRLEEVSLSPGDRLIVPLVDNSVDMGNTKLNCKGHESDKRRGVILFLECSQER